MQPQTNQALASPKDSSIEKIIRNGSWKLILLVLILFGILTILPLIDINPAALIFRVILPYLGFIFGSFSSTFFVLFTVFFCIYILYTIYKIVQYNTIYYGIPFYKTLLYIILFLSILGSGLMICDIYIQNVHEAQFRDSETYMYQRRKEGYNQEQREKIIQELNKGSIGITRGTGSDVKYFDIYKGPSRPSENVYGYEMSDLVRIIKDDTSWQSQFSGVVISDVEYCKQSDLLPFCQKAFN